MSHFCVLVIGNDVEALMAPFQENNMGDCPEQYLEFFDKEAESLEEYNTGTSRRVKMPDGRLLFPWDDTFHVSSTGFGSNTHKVPDELEQADVPFKELYPTFEEFMEEYQGYTRDSKTGKYGYWENPNAKWDWWVVGGRYTGYLGMDQGKREDFDWGILRDKAGEKAAGLYDRARTVIDPHLDGYIPWKTLREKHGDDEARGIYWQQEAVKAFKADEELMWYGIEEFLVRRADYIQEARNRAGVTFAVVKDGKWYERGEMGWWACVSNEKDRDEWNREFHSLVDSLPGDTQLTVVDCHI